MAFTTKLILKKDKPEEKYDFPVLTQQSYNTASVKKEYAVFELNLAAMKEFGFEPNTPNTNKINWGVDDETNELLLANTKGLLKEKSSDITAANIFYNQKLLDKLVEKFSVDPLQIHEFELSLCPEGDFMIASLKLIKEEVLASDDKVERNIDTFNEMVKEELNKQEAIKFEQF